LEEFDELFGFTKASSITPLSIETYKNSLVKRNLSPQYIADKIGIIQKVFKWGVAQQLISFDVYNSLTTVDGVWPEETKSKKRDAGAIADSVVDATIPFLPATIACMVNFQRLTGARPGEICKMRPMDIKRTGEVWEYRPSSHKTQHHGKSRVIFIGPQAQSILTPFLDRPADAYCFSPIESEAQRLADLRAKRKAPVQPSQSKRKKKTPRIKPGEAYTVDSYRRAIIRGVRKANRQRKKSGVETLPEWKPNQLRHTAGTVIRELYGLEAAQVFLGHTKADVTQIYAERDMKKGKKVAKEIG
jgi:integrase